MKTWERPVPEMGTLLRELSPIDPRPTPEAERPSLTLEAIATASVAPAEALSFLTEFLHTTDRRDTAAEAVYEALRGLVWTFVSGREDGDLVDTWGAIILRIRQQMRKNAMALVAERLTALADLLSDATRFPRLHSRAKLGARKHVREILKVLSDHGGRAGRKVVAEATGLKDANLSRVLANLASAGLIHRYTEGGGVSIEMTAEGRIEASQLGIGTGAATMFGDPFVVNSISLLWQKTGAALAVIDGGTLIACDDAFAMLVGDMNAEALIGKPAEAIKRKLADATTVYDTGFPYEIKRTDGTVVGLTEFDDGARSLWLGCDVTSYRRSISDLQQRELLLLESTSIATNKQGATAPFVPVVGTPELGWSAMSCFREDVLSSTNAIGYLTNSIVSWLEKPRFSPGDLDVAISLRDEAHRLSSLVKDYTRIGELLNVQKWPVSSVRPEDTIRDVIKVLPHTDAILEWEDSPVGGPLEVQLYEPGYRTVLMHAIVSAANVTPSGSKVVITCRMGDGHLFTSLRTASFGPKFTKGIAERDLTAFYYYVVQHFGGSYKTESGDEGVRTDFSWPLKMHHPQRLTGPRRMARTRPR